jgi:hypothetical protein
MQATLSLFNFAGVGGAIAGAMLIQRVGSRVALLAIPPSAAASLVMAAPPPVRKRFFGRWSCSLSQAR